MSEEKLFTQVEVDEIIQDRLRRSKRQLERELVEAQADAVAELPDYKKQYFDNYKKIKLHEAGVPFDQLEKYAKYIDAEDEKEIQAQAEELAADVLTKQESPFADPGTKRKSIWNPWG